VEQLLADQEEDEDEETEDARLARQILSADQDPDHEVSRAQF